MWPIRYHRRRVRLNQSLLGKCRPSIGGIPIWWKLDKVPDFSSSIVFGKLNRAALIWGLRVTRAKVRLQIPPIYLKGPYTARSEESNFHISQQIYYSLNCLYRKTVLSRVRDTWNSTQRWFSTHIFRSADLNDYFRICIRYGLNTFRNRYHFGSCSASF